MRSYLLALAALLPLALTAGIARADFVLGVNFGDPSVTPDVTIGGNLFKNEADATGLSLSDNWQHFDYEAIFNLPPLTPAVSDAVDHALDETLLLTGDQASGEIHQVVPSGQAYLVTLYYIEGFADNNRSFNLTGDISGTGLGLLPYDTWTSVTFTTPVINDGSIDFTVVNTKDQPVLSAFSVSTVPEPTTLAMLALAGVGLLGRRGRKSQRARISPTPATIPGAMLLAPTFPMR